MNSKNIYSWLILILILVILLIGSVALKNKFGSKSEPNIANINTNANTSNQEPANISKIQAMCMNPQEQTSVFPAEARQTKTGMFFNYSDDCLNFNLNYPDKLFTTSKENVSLPGVNGTDKIKTIDVFKHTINIQHCALSGKCTATTTDMSWGATARQETFDPKNYPQLDFKKTIYGDKTAYEAQMGAEGEGIVYTMIPFPDNTGEKDGRPDYVIILYRTYIDESIEANYKTAAGFLPLSKQAEIYKNIISSLD